MTYLERRGKATVIAMAIIAAITFVSWASAGWKDLPHAVESVIIDRRDNWPEPIQQLERPKANPTNWRHETVINMPANVPPPAGGRACVGLVPTTCK